ncbi:hypothetical protein [Fodinicola feengrottensis]|uniref:hypothetical protein n=1 Tax=Fodinicola feengrottensis TaxID=435914 RepID=UPI0013D59E2C|nr:hypothetical protein [Fodinicola feengrottensis]
MSSSWGNLGQLDRVSDGLTAFLRQNAGPYRMSADEAAALNDSNSAVLERSEELLVRLDEVVDSPASYESRPPRMHSRRHFC